MILSVHLMRVASKDVCCHGWPSVMRAGQQIEAHNFQGPNYIYMCVYIILIFL